MTNLQTKRQCLFCTSKNLTKEHILPKWLKKKFGKRVPGLHVIGNSDGSTTEFTGKAFDQTAKIVCATCNNGWMSILENEAEKVLEPLILGTTSAQISPEGLSIVARWVAKTLIVLEYFRPEVEHHIPRSIAHNLYNQRRLLDELTIYLGFRDQAFGEGGAHIAGFKVQSARDIKCKPEHKDHVLKSKHTNSKIFSAGLVIGHAYFFMMGTDIKNGYVFLHPRNEAQLMEIWPQHSDSIVYWPNTTSIDQTENWEKFTDRLNNLASIDFYQS